MTAKTKKTDFDCVAYQREQRKRLSRKFEGMTNAEINAWIRDYRPTDPILRRFMERTRRTPTGAESVPDMGSDEVDVSQRNRSEETR